MERDATMETLIAQRDALVAERQERSRSIPAHSIRPHQLLILEELDERIAELQRKIDALPGKGT